MATRQRDRVGIITFDEDIVTHVPPSAKHFDMVLHTLDRAKAERPGHLSAPLHKMAEHFKRRGILLLISDFYDEPDAILDAIKPLKFLGNDLIVFHVLDPQE
ncbi:MAG: vWA domain-containing protein, partial [Gallionella sp.]